MKFQPETLAGANLIARHERGAVWVGADRHARSVLVPWQGPVLGWEIPGLEALEASHFEAAARLEPEVVIFGCGVRLRFPRPECLRGLVERGIGIETMDTAAACRTYNVLVTERRRVVAALLIEPPPP